MSDIETTIGTRAFALPAIGEVEVNYTERGNGHPVLLLHGGAGPQSVIGFADLLAATDGVRVITPTHPGFDGTPRPASLHSMAGLAAVYSRLLDELDLENVTVIGNSIGGWIAAEIVLLGSPRVGRAVLVDAVGLQLDEHPIVDFFGLTLDQVVALSYFAPDAFRIDVSTFSEPQKAMMAANRAALQAYGGTTMADPGLQGRLPGIATPTLVVWGEADRVVPPEHGSAYADAIPGARLHLIREAGHLPQLEAPEELRRTVVGFIDEGGAERV